MGFLGRGFKCHIQHNKTFSGFFPCRTWKILSPVSPGDETAWIFPGTSKKFGNLHNALDLYTSITTALAMAIQYSSSYHTCGGITGTTTLLYKHRHQSRHLSGLLPGTYSSSSWGNPTAPLRSPTPLKDSGRSMGAARPIFYNGINDIGGCNWRIQTRYR